MEFVRADVQNYPELVKALNGMDVAFYLIHSMEGSSSNGKNLQSVIELLHKILLGQ